MHDVICKSHKEVQYSYSSFNDYELELLNPRKKDTLNGVFTETTYDGQTDGEVIFQEDYSSWYPLSC